ncbi:DUF433 domain-containing protein [Rhabdaerophilum sp. SD176]|uniref:DUF433 domain-containing protein n=1 Tax=Rhabdaerophilum sp. SD176 TaxID=2983548 RepID=UPI0024DFF661|nr:DUF433 domain-containing protein [Rhabdaerophilum sp. SD176]
MTIQSEKQVVSAFTEDQASRLSGISVHQLRYWDRTGLFSPQFADENRRAAYSRVYSFQDITALRVLNVLTKQYSVSVQHLREVAEKLCALDNSAWSRVTLYVLNRRVNFDDPEDGRQREVVSGQYSIGIPLEKVVSDTRRDIKDLSERDAKQIGKIQRSRNVSHNAPVISGTRIPVRAIKNFHEDGYTIEQILAEYPSLSAADVKAAIDFEQGSKAA